MAKSSTDESSDEEKDDCSTSKICKILWLELMEKCGNVFKKIYAMNISTQSAMRREIFQQMMIFFVHMFVVFAFDRKCLGQIFHSTVHSGA